MEIEDKYKDDMRTTDKKIRKILDKKNSLRTQEKVAILWIILHDLYREDLDISDSERKARIEEAIGIQIKRFAALTIGDLQTT